MGVSGLYTVLRDNRSECVETVDLLAEAEKAKTLGQGPLEIIVDFCAMRDEIGRKIAELFARPPYANPYLTLPVGEYDLIHNIVRHLLQQLKAAGLKLTFVFDCLKISNEEEQHLKHDLWRTRISINLVEQAKMMSTMQNPNFTFQNYKVGAVRLPWYDALWQTLITEMGFECHAPHGQESDFFRAQMQHQRKAFAVLANDTDYVLFPDCPVILWQMFDEEKHLSYDPKPDSPVTAPRKLICGRVVSSRLWRCLQLSSHDQLIDVTSVLGNLFTTPFVDGISFMRSFRLPHCKSRFHAVAQLIRRQNSYTGVENCLDVQHKIKGKPGFREAFVTARRYFNLDSDTLKLDAGVYENDLILKFLAKPENMLRLGDWPSRLRRRSFWPFALLEEHRIVSYQEAIMLWLRHIFALVHKTSEQASVYVYFRARNSTDVEMTLVQPVASGDGSTVEEFMADNVEDNMKRFAEIMNCYRVTKRADSPNEEADRLCDMLNPNDFMRAFLVFCWRLALDVEPEKGYFTDGGHLLALTTSMLTLWDPEVREEVMPLLEQLYAVRIVPTPSQVTIFNWMQIITVTANDCALFLYLERFLSPILPRMFSFSLFLAYVHIRESKFYGKRELCESLEAVQRKVIHKYCGLLKLVPVLEAVDS